MHDDDGAQPPPPAVKKAPRKTASIKPHKSSTPKLQDILDEEAHANLFQKPAGRPRTIPRLMAGEEEEEEEDDVPISDAE